VLPVKFHPEASRETEETRAWYERQKKNLGAEFLQEIENAMEKIQQAPAAWLNYKFGTKRILVHRFPYSIVYRTKESMIQIVAIAHHKRKPFYWKDRKF